VKAILARLTPTVLVSFTVLILAVLAASGVTLSALEQGAVVAFVAAGAVVLLLHRTVESITALVGAAIALAVAFGLSVTAAQQESILILVGAATSIVLGKAGVKAVKARRTAGKLFRSGVTPSSTLTVAIDTDTTKLEEALDRSLAKTLELRDAVAAVGDKLPSASKRRKKGGRLPAFVPPGLKTLMEYATKTLTAPATFDVPEGSYPMDNNDVEGDCTIAGVAHLLQAWNRLFIKGKARIPGLATIKKTYRKLTGGEDTGLVEANVLAAWKSTGLFGTKIKAYTPVKVTDLNAIKCAVAYYGGCYLGIVVGQPQEEQFDRGEPWKWVKGQEQDGHCVVALGFTKNGLLCATWGGIALLPWAFLKPALQEAWCVFGPQLAAAGKDTLGVDVAQLEADLSRI